MAFDPFSGINQTLQGIIAQQQSPQYAETSARINQAQDKQVRMGVMSEYLANADLSKISPTDFLKTIASMSGNTTMVPAIAEQMIKENQFQRSLEKLELAKQKFAEITAKGSDFDEGISDTERSRFQVETGIKLPTSRKQAGQTFTETYEAEKAKSLFKEESGDKKIGGVAKFKAEKDLRGEFLDLSKEFIKQRDAFQRIEASAENPSPAGDLSLIFNFMKILDPGSVVRESEFENAAKAQEFLEARGISWEKVKRVWRGEKLGTKARKDFVNRAGRLFSKASKSHKKREKQYTGLAKRYGIPAENVIIDINEITGESVENLLNKDKQQQIDVGKIGQANIQSQQTAQSSQAQSQTQPLDIDNWIKMQMEGGF